jgi:basic membrane lipoprotein Med (substrate-binding protein (PBP1-ABC) superfamily)
MQRHCLSKPTSSRFSFVLRRSGQTGGLLALLVAVLLSYGCSLTAKSDVAGGLGSPCQRDDQCQAAKCTFPTGETKATGGICTIACSSDAECPSGTLCAKSLCQTPLSVGVALTGNVTELEGWTFAHVQGLDQAAAELGYVKLDKRFGLIPGNVLEDIKDIAKTNQIVIGNTVDYIPDFQRAAQAIPDRNFVCIDDGVYMTGSANFTTYWIHRAQAWYAAGKVAATIAQNRLGVISAFINPETVFDVNAFTLGARTIKPNIVVEVRHMGFWFDINDTPVYSYTHTNGMTRQYFREEYLAALMIDSGCEVIAHIGNTQRTVRLLEKLRSQGLAKTDQYSFANDNQKGYLDGTGAPIRSCIGSIYENWYPLYRDLFEAAHRGTFNPFKSLDYDIDDTENSPTGVSINPQGPGDSIAARKIVQDLARARNPSARQKVLVGPYAVNGQRDRNQDGIPDAVQTVSAGELIEVAEASKMCWYVAGVVEKSVLSDPTSADRPALVPGGLVPGATQPGSRVAYPADDTLVIPQGLSTQCLANTF